ncbi:MAG: sigma-70 family RNA polymerase sigma factor [Verrucomicrobiales bacterium]|nr:sigma-70 family RNA polymerase sigma factor [Verrucomicrobiales bacterium]
MSEACASEPCSPRGGRFVTTHWSRLVLATREDSPAATAALEELCRTYWYPLYAFVRRQGKNPADAEDAVQAFFARLLSKKLLARADPARGRFRAFLLTAFMNFLVSEWERETATKRGGGQPVLSLENLQPETVYSRDADPALTPDQAYDRAWACRLLATVREHVRMDYAERGQARRYELLEAFLPGGDGQLSYSEAAAELGLGEVSVRAEVHRLKKRYRAALRTEIAATVSSAEEVDEELRSLMAGVAGSP